MRKGFTLVELIVVIVILAILATVAFITLQDYPIQARDTKRLDEVGKLADKVSMETADGIKKYKNLIKKESVKSIEFKSGSTIVYRGEMGYIDATQIGESDDAFKDPTGKESYAFLWLEGGTGENRVYCFEVGSFSEKDYHNYSRGNCVNKKHLLDKTDIQKDGLSATLTGSLFSLSGSTTLKNIIDKDEANKLFN